MSRRAIFLILYGVIVLSMVIPMFLSHGGSLLVKFVWAGLSAFIVFFGLGSMWLVWERDEARDHQIEENNQDR